MYNDEYDDEEEETKKENFIVNFYYNNKLLIWILCGILLFILIMSLLTKGGSNSEKELEYNVSIQPEGEVTVSIGTSTNVIATVKNNPNAEIIWTVDPPTIAKVDNGNITGLDYGKAKVTATYIDSNNEKKSASIDVVVADGDPAVKLTDVSFKDGDLFMPLNSTYKIALTLTPSRGYIQNKTFTSSNTRVVTVDNTGLVTAVGEGESTIYFDVNNGEFKKELNVYVDRDYNKTEIIITPEKISFDGELRKIKVGTSEKLSYIVTPENADRTKLIWKSSNEEVVSVDESGRITGLKEGKARITVSSVNGKDDVIDVEVESDIIPVTSIELSVSEISLTVGQSQTITPIVIPDSASNKTLSYTSLDNSIVVVSPNETGTQATITPISVGYTSIIIKSTNGVEKRLSVAVTSSSGGESGGGSSGGSSGSSTSTQGFKISSKDANNEGYVNATYEKTKPANNGATGPVTITVTKTDSSVNKLKVIVCNYPADNNCNDYSNGIITITNSDSFTINDVGEYVIRVFEYDSNNNLTRTTDKYIWVKELNGGSKPTITCKNPVYNGKSQVIATCSGGTITLNETGTSIKTYIVECKNSSGVTASKMCSIKNSSTTPTPTTTNKPTVTATANPCQITNCAHYAQPRTASSCYCDTCAPNYVSKDGGKTCSLISATSSPTSSNISFAMGSEKTILLYGNNYNVKTLTVTAKNSSIIEEVQYSVGSCSFTGNKRSYSNQTVNMQGVGNCTTGSKGNNYYYLDKNYSKLANGGIVFSSPYTSAQVPFCIVQGNTLCVRVKYKTSAGSEFFTVNKTYNF